jgi:hypothetical protein
VGWKACNSPGTNVADLGRQAHHLRTCCRDEDRDVADLVQADVVQCCPQVCDVLAQLGHRLAGVGTSDSGEDAAATGHVVEGEQRPGGDGGRPAARLKDASAELEAAGVGSDVAQRRERVGAEPLRGEHGVVTELLGEPDPLHRHVEPAVLPAHFGRQILDHSASQLACDQVGNHRGRGAT